MFTLLVGVLLVAGSAVGFGLALFGRRPIPQPAMSRAATPLLTEATETGPSSDDPRSPGAVAVATRPATAPDDGLTTKVAPWWQRVLQRDATAEHVDASDVALSGWVRGRSAVLLLLTIAGLAALLGVLTSIVVVGLGLLVT